MKLKLKRRGIYEMTTNTKMLCQHPGEGKETYITTTFPHSKLFIQFEYESNVSDGNNLYRLKNTDH